MRLKYQFFVVHYYCIFLNKVYMTSTPYNLSLGKVVENLVNTTSSDSSSTITKSYVPSYVYEYANYSSSSVKSAILYIKLKNISGSTLILNGYQIWINFKDETGNTIAKPSTSIAFDAQSYSEISIPPSTVSNGDEYSYVIKLTNVDYELLSNNITTAKYWSIGFRQDTNFGITNLFQNNAILSYQITIIPSP